jgi:hypothetical protein
MIKTRTTIILLVAVIISAGIWIAALNKQPKKKTSFLAKIFETANGWGYDILVNDTLFIHQEYVPVIAGKKSFLKKEQAEQTARLIINKMKGGQLPTVTTFELEQIIPLNQLQYGEPGDPQ